MHVPARGHVCTAACGCRSLVEACHAALHGLTRAWYACSGLEAVPAAQDRLHSGQSMGKVVVQVAADVPACIQAASKL